MWMKRKVLQVINVLALDQECFLDIQKSKMLLLKEFKDKYIVVIAAVN